MIGRHFWLLLTLYRGMYSWSLVRIARWLLKAHCASAVGSALSFGRHRLVGHWKYSAIGSTRPLEVLGHWNGSTRTLGVGRLQPICALASGKHSEDHT
jgi:hypothetical protein